MIAYVLRWLADRLDTVEADAMEIPRLSPIDRPHTVFVNDETRAMRNETALRLLDDDTLGYVVLRIAREDDGNGRIAVDAQVERGAWSSMLAAMARVTLAGEQAIS